MKNCELAKSKIIDLIHGLIFDQKLVRIKSEEQLILYCYRVAGTVGVLMCIALECKDKNSFNFAIDLGIAMQLTNILRDIEEDSKLNRRYLPGKFINDCYVTLTSILWLKNITTITKIFKDNFVQCNGSL